MPDRQGETPCERTHVKECARARGALRALYARCRCHAMLYARACAARCYTQNKTKQRKFCALHALCCALLLLIKPQRQCRALLCATSARTNSKQQTEQQHSAARMHACAHGRTYTVREYC